MDLIFGAIFPESFLSNGEASTTALARDFDASILKNCLVGEYEVKIQVWWDVLLM